MSKKEKKASASTENLEAIIALVPKLEALVKTHKEISAEYQKYRKNGGEEIPGIEKHLGSKEKIVKAAVKTKKTDKPLVPETPEQEIEAKKAKKKAK